MTWITVTVPPERNDLLQRLLLLSAHRRAIVRAHIGRKGERVVEINLDVEGEQAAQALMRGLSEVG